MPAYSPSGSIQAFLRGIERRAYVLLVSQCGEAEIARGALGGLLPVFLAEAGNLPVAQWPLRFWALLLRQPAMLRSDRVEPGLAALGPGRRAALLLRLVAGLDPPHAARAMGVDEAVYRHALQSALARLQRQGVDLDGLRDQLLERVRLLGDRQIAAIGRVREQALADLASSGQEALPAPPPSALPRQVGLRRGAWAGLALLALAFAATFVEPRGPAPDAGVAEPLAVEPMAMTPETEVAALVTDPDYGLLALTASDAALAEDLAFQSWLVAGGATDPEVEASAGLPEAPESAGADEAQP